jgi:hypothetical protein
MPDWVEFLRKSEYQVPIPAVLKYVAFPMTKLLESRAVRFVLIVLVAFLATCITVFALNLFSPPRPLAQLLPTRTPTRRPPPTITPVAYPPTPQIVLADDFAAQENFPRASGVKLGYEYTDNAYVLTPPLDPGFVRVLQANFEDPDYRNLTLDAAAGPTVDSSPVEYGVLFWHGEDDQGRERFLAFTVNSESSFRLLAYEPVADSEDNAEAFQFTEIIPSTRTQTLHLDGTPNRIRVDVHPRRLLAYINDELVLDTNHDIINDWRLARDWDGRVGLIAFTMDAPGAQAQFSQFDIYADVKTQ